MNKIILTIVIAIFSLSVYATGFENDYIVTEEGVSYYNDMNYGLSSYLIAKDENNNKIKYAKEDILQYRKDGQVFHKKDLSAKGITDENTFLKLLKTKNGFSMYMHNNYTANGDLDQSFYVFKGNEFVLEVDKKNMMQILAFYN